MPERESDLYGLKVFAFEPLKYVMGLANRGSATRHEANELEKAYWKQIDKTMAERHPGLLRDTPLWDRKRQPERKDYA